MIELEEILRLEFSTEIVKGRDLRLAITQIIIRKVVTKDD